MARTALFARTRPGGVLTISDIRETPAEAIFLDSVNGASGNDGFTPDTAVVTLTAAIAAATAAKRDTIYVAPFHAESRTSSGNIADINKSCLRIIGLGGEQGADMPTFTLGHASATLTISAANVLVRGIKVIADAADVAVGVTASAAADGLVIEDCWMTSGALTKELQVGVSIAALCTDVTIRRNVFETIDTDETGSETHAILLAGAADRIRILDNEMVGNFGTAAIAGTVAASVHVRILRNYINNTDTTNGLAISLHASTTGIVADNRLLGLKTNTKPIVAAGCAVHENYTSAAAGESGIVWPAVETYA